MVVASEGIVSTNTSRIGTGNAGFTVKSIGVLPELDLGLLGTNDITYNGALEGGEVAAFHFHAIPYPVTLGFEVSLEQQVGNPAIVAHFGMDLPDPGSSSTGSGGGVAADPYGND